MKFTPATAIVVKSESWWSNLDCPLGMHRASLDSHPANGQSDSRDNNQPSAQVEYQAKPYGLGSVCDGSCWKFSLLRRIDSVLDRYGGLFFLYAVHIDIGEG